MGFNASLIERTIIREKAKMNGVKLADYLRDLALKGKVRRRPTIEEIKLFRDLAGVSNNLNQLTREAHRQNLSILIPKLLKTLDELNKLIESYDHKD